MPQKFRAATVLALLVGCRHEQPAPAIATLDVPRATPAPPDGGRAERAEAPSVAFDASDDGGPSAESPTTEPLVGETTSPIFMTYPGRMHDRIHRIFAEQFLAQLTTLRPDHPLNDPRLVTVLEIRLARTGAIDRVGIVRSSGIAAFDIATVDAVVRAAPFAKPPSDVRSFDGKVYVQWSFRRDGADGCAVGNARPFVLGH